MFNHLEFKAQLFDRISAYFEQKEDDNEEISHEEIMLLRAISLLSLPERKGTQRLIVEKIAHYVEVNQSEMVSDFVQVLYKETSSFREKMQSPLIKNKVTFQLSAIIDDDPIAKDEFVKVMMHRYRLEKPDYNGYLVSSDRDDNSAINASQQQTGIGHPATDILYERINAVIDSSQSKRIQVIVRQTDHYTAMDIDKEKGSCFVMDAAGDLRQFNLHELVKKSPVIQNVYYVEVEKFLSPKGIEKQARLQHDECSCSTFALDHSFEVAKHQDIHQWLESNATTSEGQSNRHHVTWTQLDPGFVRNAQSPTFREYYQDKRRDEAASIGEFFRENCLDTTKKDFIEKSIDMLNQLDEESLKQIVLDAPSESKPAQIMGHYKSNLVRSDNDVNNPKNTI